MYRILPVILVAAALLALAAGEATRAQSDSGVIYAFRSPSDGSDSFVAIDPDTGEQTSVAIGFSRFYLPNVSRDGATVVFGSDGLRTLDLRDGTATSIPGTTNNTHTPAWSPDRSRLVVTDIGPEGWTWDLYTMNADGSDKRLIVDSNGTADFADWSPDGTRIAYIRTAGPGDPSQIWVANADGSAQTAVTSEGANWFPDWSPDGTQIAYASVRDGVSAIRVMNADGTGDHALLADRACTAPTWPPSGSANCTGGDDWPSWSPDGTQIVFTSGWNVMVANADGSGLRQLTDSGVDLYPDWVPAPGPDSAPLVPTPTLVPAPSETPLETVIASLAPEQTPSGSPTIRPTRSVSATPEASIEPLPDASASGDSGGRSVGAVATTVAVLIGLPALVVFGARRFT